MLRVTFFFFLQFGGASWWRVCYQQGLPRLDFTVQDFTFKIYDESPLFNIFGEGLFVWLHNFYVQISFKNSSFSVKCLIYLHVLVSPGHPLPSLPPRPTTNLPDNLPQAAPNCLRGLQEDPRRLHLWQTWSNRTYLEMKKRTTQLLRETWSMDLIEGGSDDD